MLTRFNEIKIELIAENIERKALLLTKIYGYQTEIGFSLDSVIESVSIPNVHFWAKNPWGEMLYIVEREKKVVA